jgi:hypothetical protein
MYEYEASVLEYLKEVCEEIAKRYLDEDGEYRPFG